MSAAINECGDSFDIEKAIADLRSDSNCSSLQLPCLLTAEQRKYAKAIVEQYPDLKCESYGFGKDRRMHLFKSKSVDESNCTNEATAPSPQNVSVKNTFIDDWIDVDVMPADGRVVQSMPHNMFGQCLSAELGSQVQPTTEGRDVVAADQKATPIVPRMTEGVQAIAVGTEVVIDGLVKAPSYNGAVGIVQSWDSETDRYNVLLRTSTANGHCWAKIKGENLRRAQPR
jgi:hypothetical protein